ncbi:MAG: sensor histidine kinase [Bryobacteraceae bacterium]|jgi:signal transduction histidine kinase
MASVIEPAVSPTARRYIESLLRILAPAADRLERQFRGLLRERKQDGQEPARRRGGAGAPAPPPRTSGSDPPRREREARIRALAAITPAAASRLRTLAQFFEQVEYNGRRLAKLNVPPEEAGAALDSFGTLLDPVLAGAFQPAREQLRLATVLTLNKAYYEVREAEAQTLFGLYRAEMEAAGLEEALRGFVRVLTRAVRARAGRLTLRDGAGASRLARPLYAERGSAAERLISSDLSKGRYASYWSYPVGETAAVQFGFAVPYPWLPRELALLGAAAKRCGEAMDRARLENAMKRLQAEARRAEEEERRRIGRELHDEVGQSLLFLRLQLEMLEREAPEPLARRLREARGMAGRTVAELRRIVAALSPATLERLGLRPALRRLAERFRRTHPCKLRVSLAELAAPLSRRQEEVVYRVAQECLQNITKHSGATRVMLSLGTADSRVRLRVTDNGAGFCADEIRKKAMAFGLEGMRERAALIGGTLAIRSAPGKGARIVLDLPYSAAAVAHHVENSHIAH